MPFINFEGRKIEFAAGSGDSLLTLLVKNGCFVDAPCGGNGTCGKCRVHVRIGNLDTTCLSCSSQPEDGMEVQGLQRTDIQVETEQKAFHYDDIADGDACGLAVDIGTTTVVAYFYRLATGEQLAVKSGMNTQRVFGADVISRIAKAMEQASADELHMLIAGQLSGYITAFCSEFGCHRDSITTVAICGNTAMLHFACGLPTLGLAYAPYAPTSLFGYVVNAKQLGLSLHEATPVYLAPCVSAFVGGDITAGMAAYELQYAASPVLYIDIGTNGEIALGDCHGFLCCAAAAGPAFEGAHITYGVGGIKGAISAVTVQADGTLAIRTIGDEQPVGICGSGLLDAIAALRQIGAIDETGLLDEKYDEAYILDPHSKIAITQRDIREVQLAKSAIAAGIVTLLHEAELTGKQVARVILAGGFGAKLNPASACAIGLLPQELFSQELLPKIEVVGNAAGAGAIRCILQQKEKWEMQALCNLCTYIELSESAYFSDAFIENMAL